jgi:TetR/AcrR family transcriptional regulator, mexCD-oprJ operon repressor
MARKTTPAPVSRRRRRSDADRSVAAILAAALEALAGDPDASMAEIARRAGVVRATTYVHFPTRESLLDAVMEHAVAEVARAASAAKPEDGEPREALERVLRATWQKLDGFQALLTINTSRLSPEELHRRHLPVLTHFVPLIERGQEAGDFRSDLPVSWHLAVIRALAHTASFELQAGRISAADAEGAMLTTVLAAISEPAGVGRQVLPRAKAARVR